MLERESEADADEGETASESWGLASVGRDGQGIELGSQPGFEMLWARLQRIAWIVMGVLLILGVAGAFGSGPLDHARAQAAGGSLRVDYQPIVHDLTPTVLQLHLSPALARGGLVQVRAGATLLQQMQIREVWPRPVAWEVGRQGPILTFRLQPAGGSISLSVEPGAVGSYAIELAAGNAASVSLHQFVLP